MSGSSDAPGDPTVDRVGDGAHRPASAGARAALAGRPPPALRRPADGPVALPDELPPHAEERVNRSIGERVRARRHTLGLTLKEVSGRTGLSVSLISQIELGRSAASVQSLYKVSLSLGVPMATFFEGL